MTFPYSNMIQRFPNLAPNSSSKDYRRFKAAYEQRIRMLSCGGKPISEETCLNAFLQVLNDNISK